MWDSLQPGTYYVVVTSLDEAPGTYRLVTTPIVDTTATANAQPIPLGGFRNAMIDPFADVDWFTFTLAEQTGVIVHGSSAIDGEIHDAAGEPVADLESFGLPPSGFLHKATLAPGQYYIRTTITPGRLFPALYTVRLLEAAEPGSTLAAALPLTPYEPAVGTIDPSNDVDYLRIEVDGTLHARLRAVGAAIDIVGELLDSNGNTVGDAVLYENTFEYGGPVGFMLLDELGDGTHYVKVTGSSNQPTGAATGSYAVVLSEDLDYTAFIDSCTQITTSFSDPLYGCQWHLDNSGQQEGTPGEGGGCHSAVMLRSLAVRLTVGSPGTVEGTAEPGADHAPVPTSLTAATRTSWERPSVSPERTASVEVSVWDRSCQPPLFERVVRYCTSNPVSGESTIV